MPLGHLDNFFGTNGRARLSYTFNYDAIRRCNIGSIERNSCWLLAIGNNERRPMYCSTIIEMIFRDRVVVIRRNEFR